MTLQFLRLTFFGAVCALAAGAPAIAGPSPEITAPVPSMAVPTGRLSDFTVTTWNETNGLSAGAITAMAQDLDGYLYIGTDIGLLRFDGVRFQSLGQAIGQPRPPFESITALLSARDKSLWVGVGASLVRVNKGTHTKYTAAEGMPAAVNWLLEDRRGTVWAGTSEGLRQFVGNRWEPQGMEVGLDTEPTLAMHEDRAGRFWVATRTDVFRRERGGAPFIWVDEIGTSSRVWQGFAEDVNGDVWITDFYGGLRRVTQKPDPHRRHSGRGVRLLQDQRGNLWVATRGQGLWRRHSTSSGPILDVITAKDGLANDAVQTIFEDREGNIWVGTNGGLQRLTPHQVTPLTDIPIARAIAPAPDGSIWVGTTVGLIGLTPHGRRQYQAAQGLPGVVVLGLAVDPRGAVWVATERALARFEHGTFTQILPVNQDRRLFSIAFSDGSVWLRDVNFDLRRITENGRELPLDDVPEDFRSRVFTLVTDRQGRVWIATTKGLVGLRSPGGAFRPLDPGVGSISAIYEDSAGAMWFGGEFGFSRFADERFTKVTARNGLRSGVSSIVEDESGVIWMGLRSGIARVSKEEIALAVKSSDHQLRFRLFNSAEGVAGIPVTAGSRTVVRSQDGRLWFLTAGGVTVVDPDTIVTEDPLPRVPVKFESITTQNQSFEPAEDLRLPPRASHVQLAFTAITLTDSMRIHFRYKLEGQDSDWVDAGTNRQVSYTNLPPGPYRFLLSASNGDAFDDARILTFSVAPAFYQTRWFYALCFLGVASIVYGAWRLNARRVREQFALVLAERIRMSRTIHDTLLQGFAGLALQLDDLSHGIDAHSAPLKERVQSMRRRVEDYIREARQSIWDLRQPALDAKPFPEALRDAGLRAINGAPVEFDFATAGTPRPCSPAVQEQLLHICQEAITNAVRHGAPARVGVELEYLDKAVRVRVDDDGRGFDPACVAGGTDGHYGVISMKERAAQVRGRLTIASSPGRGTRVETVVPPM